MTDEAKVRSSASDAPHPEGCRCVRCVGFESGNQVSVRHGAYSKLGLTEAAKPVAEQLRDLVPVSSPSDEPVIALLAVSLVQLSRAAAALEAAGDDRDKMLRLSADAQGWTKRAADLAAELGMTPRSRARLGLDLASLADRRAPQAFDPSLLTDKERVTLARLMQKAEVVSHD